VPKASAGADLCRRHAGLDGRFDVARRGRHFGIGLRKLFADAGRSLVGEPLAREVWLEVPVYDWAGAPRPLLRISAQAYNTLDDYAKLADGIKALLRRP